MSNIWNPHAFGVTGQPVGPQVNTLRVYGAEPTKEQLAMAQQAFAKFCMTERLSFAPNQTQQGFLPDGSKYRIVVVGNTRIMEVRVEGDDPTEGIVRSGIVITLTNLDGSNIPAHSEDGVPITYLLTPKTKKIPKNSRVATGEWVVRKLKEPNGGGKAVQTNEIGDKYFTSIGPESKELLPYGDNQSNGFTNCRAYFAENIEAGGTYYHGVNVGSGGIAPIAFVLTDGDDSYAARVLIGSDDPVVVDLYIGKWTATADAIVGEGLLGLLVDSVTLPTGSVVFGSSPTIKPDGSSIRLLIARDGKKCTGTLNITKTSISYTAGACATPGVPNHQTITPTINEVNIGETWYGDDGANVLWGGQHLSTFNYETGDEWYSSENNEITFGFGPRGEDVSTNRVGRSHTQTRVNTRHTTAENYSIINYNHYPPTTGGFWESSEAVTGLIRQTMTLGGVAEFALEESSQEILIREEVWQYSVSSHGEVGGTLYDGTITWANTGGGEGHYLENDTYYSPLTFGEIYWERFLKFAIYTEFHGRKYRYDWTYTPGDNSTVTRTNGPGIVTPAIAYLVVKHKGSFLMKLDITGDTRKYLVYVASDPKTSAVLVNLLAVEGVDRTPKESWLYLVDDDGAKLLNTVMDDIPSNAMARSNADLYTL